MTVAFDSSVMASSRLAHPVPDSVHPTLVWARFGSIETSESLPHSGPNRPLDLGWLAEGRTCWRPCRSIQDHFHCQSCQDHCCVSLLCVCVWELWFIRIIHSQTRTFNPLEQFLQFRAWCGLFMQIMLHVPLVVDQVLYAYNKKKAGNIPKNVLNCWVNLLGFFFLLSGIFQLWVTSVSVTGALQTALGSSWLWR